MDRHLNISGHHVVVVRYLHDFSYRFRYRKQIGPDGRESWSEHIYLCDADASELKIRMAVRYALQAKLISMIQVIEEERNAGAS